MFLYGLSLISHKWIVGSDVKVIIRYLSVNLGARRKGIVISWPCKGLYSSC